MTKILRNAHEYNIDDNENYILKISHYKKTTFAIILNLTTIIGCSYTSVSYDNSSIPPNEINRIIMIGEISGEAPEFYDGLLSELQTLPNLQLIKENTESVPQRSLILNGIIHFNAAEDIWSTLGRGIIGLGLGKITLEGEFLLNDSAGKELLKFKASERYAGGSGIGGIWDFPALMLGGLQSGGWPIPADFLDEEALQRRLGKKVGKIVVKWLKLGTK